MMQDRDAAQEAHEPVGRGADERTDGTGRARQPDDHGDRGASAGVVRPSRVVSAASVLRALRIVCRSAGALLALAPLLLFLGSGPADLSTLPPSGLTLVLGETVVPPYATVPMLVVPGLLLVGAGFARMPGRGESSPLAGCLMSCLVVGLAGFVLAGSVGFLWLRSEGGYTLLDPPSDRGCRVLVLERFGLHDGFGALGVVRPGSMSVDWKHSYSSEDGHPYTSSNASAVWAGETATVPDPASVRTSTGDPLACG